MLTDSRFDSASTPIRALDAEADAPMPATLFADPADRYVDDRQAAAILGLSPGYMRQQRLSGRGCRFARFGRAIRYRVGDLLDWAQQQCVQSTSQIP